MQRKRRALLVICLMTLFTFLLVGNAVAQEGGTLREILKRGKVVIGVDLGSYPWGYRDDAGNPVGYDVDIAKEIAKEMELPYELVDTPSTSRGPFLMSKKVDFAIACYSRTLTRAFTISFTDPYTCSQELLIINKRCEDLRRVEDLAGHTVGVGLGETPDIYLTKHAPPGTIIKRYDPPIGRIMAVVNQKVDAAVADYSKVTALAEEYDYLRPGDDILFGDRICIGLRYGDWELLQWLNIFIDDFSRDGRNTRFYKKHFGVDPPKVIPGY